MSKTKYLDRGLVKDEDGNVLQDIRNGGSVKNVTVKSGGVGFSLKDFGKKDITIKNVEVKDGGTLIEGDKMEEDTTITVKNSKSSGNSVMFNFKN